MDTANAEIEIAVVQNKVFAFAANLINLPHWGEVVEVKADQVTPQVIGSKYTATVKTLLSKSTIALEVTAYRPSTDFTFRDHKTNSDFVLTFSQTQKGTKVTLENNALGFSLAATNKKLAQLLKNLKKYLEENEAKLAEVADTDQPKKKEQITHRSA